MLAGDAVGQRGGFLERGHGDHRAELHPALARDFGARQQRHLPLDLGLDGVGQPRVGGDEDRLRAAAMLGLRQQIRRHPGRVGRSIGDDQHLGRSGDHVDAHRAEHLALGGGDIGIAGPHDLGDRG